MKTEQRTIAQMEFERRALKARLSFAVMDDAHREDLIRRIENCDLLIAAAPAHTPADLAIKLDLLLEALAFDPALAGTSLEGVLLRALKVDIERLANGSG